MNCVSLQVNIDEASVLVLCDVKSCGSCARFTNPERRYDFIYLLDIYRIKKGCDVVSADTFGSGEKFLVPLALLSNY